MPDEDHEDPTIPPPGKRSGTGVDSISPFLKKTLATKPQLAPQPEDVTTAQQPEPPRPRTPRKRSRP